jgi:hypothetical protein
MAEKKYNFENTLDYDTLFQTDFGDNALNDFIYRFGDDDPEKQIIDTGGRSSNRVKSSQELEDEKNNIDTGAANGFEEYLRRTNAKPGESAIPPTATPTWNPDGAIKFPEGKSSGSTGKGIAQNLATEELTQGKGLLATKKMGVGDYAEVALGGIELAHNLRGDQFDTSVEGGGPGKAGGAIMSGAATGFKMGMATGNPIIGAAGAAVGGLVSTFAHTKAMKEWQGNRTRYNLNENALERAKREEEYARSEGMNSRGLLKGLRQKQLGIINT